MVALHGNLEKKSCKVQLVFIKEGRNLHLINLWMNESSNKKLSL